ncbi:hypothetical protein HK102_001721 [Quaeritorhiza haematococci]|nr:hypothetical protein HK102_001721 [Quaeritorhiza haematococci]
MLPAVTSASTPKVSDLVYDFDTLLPQFALDQQAQQLPTLTSNVTMTATNIPSNAFPSLEPSMLDLPLMPWAPTVEPSINIASPPTTAPMNEPISPVDIAASPFFLDTSFPSSSPGFTNSAMMNSSVGVPSSAMMTNILPDLSIPHVQAPEPQQEPLQSTLAGSLGVMSPIPSLFVSESRIPRTRPRNHSCPELPTSIAADSLRANQFETDLSMRRSVTTAPTTIMGRKRHRSFVFVEEDPRTGRSPSHSRPAYGWGEENAIAHLASASSSSSTSIPGMAPSIAASGLVPPHQQSLPSIPSAGFQCWCGRTYSSLATLRRHEATHAGKRFQCDKCDTKFSRSDALSRHIKANRCRGESVARPKERE